MDLRTRGGGWVSWDKVREWHGLICNTKCKIDSLGSSRIAQRDLLMLCDHLEGWDREGGWETQEGGDLEIYVYV